jgi:hypothetical protein
MYNTSERRDRETERERETDKREGDRKVKRCQRKEENNIPRVNFL